MACANFEDKTWESAYIIFIRSILNVQEGYEKALSCNGEELEGRTLKVRSGGRAFRVSLSSTGRSLTSPGVVLSRSPF